MPQVDYYTDSGGTVWVRWITDNTTTASTTGDFVWNQWQTTSTSTSITMDYRRYAPPPETEAQRQERERRRREAHEQAAKARAEAEAANEKAKTLLLAMLTDKQKHDFHRHNRFTVRGSKGGEYEIQTGYAGNVRSGRRRYCGHLPDARIPQFDHMLAQKLMIETDEEAFLAVANMSPC